MLNTPYYNTIIEIPLTSCGNMSSSNYTPYNLFCLTTQIETFLAEKERSQVINRITIEEDGKMAMKFVTYLQGEELEMAQAEMDKIVNNSPFFCVLYSARLENKYPASWVRNLLPFIEISGYYNPYVYEDRLYVNLALTNDYMKIYDSLYKNVQKQLKKRYKQGCILEAQSIVNDWSLYAIDIDESLFIPTWKDKRFAPDITYFLHTRLYGDKIIKFKLPHSLPMMHNIALYLHRPFYFVSEIEKPAYLFTEVENLQEAQEIADLVEEAMYSVIGQVYTKSFSSYEKAEKLNKENSVIYLDYGRRKPYTLSVLQGFNLPSPFSNLK